MGAREINDMKAVIFVIASEIDILREARAKKCVI